MGANYLETFITASDFEKLEKKFNKMREEAIYMSGAGGYTGDWGEVPGVTVRHDPFPEMIKWTEKKKRKVSDWLTDNAQKWEKALAVKTTKGYIVGAWASC